MSDTDPIVLLDDRYIFIPTNFSEFKSDLVTESLANLQTSSILVWLENCFKISIAWKYSAEFNDKKLNFFSLVNNFFKVSFSFESDEPMYGFIVDSFDRG